MKMLVWQVSGQKLGSENFTWCDFLFLVWMHQQTMSAVLDDACHFWVRESDKVCLH